MDSEKKDQQSLTNDQIRVTENVLSANDVLKSAKPYLNAALKALQDPAAASSRPIEVPPTVVRDLVLMLVAEIKRADQLVARRPKGDKGDGDWNPFNRIDFEFD